MSRSASTRSSVAVPERAVPPPYRSTVFARQVLPTALLIEEADLTRAVLQIVKRLETLAKRPNRQKGAWTLHMLRGVGGDEAFWRGIREYYRLYRDKNASTADLRRVIDEPSGGVYYGGSTAGPVFAQVMAASLRQLAVPPDAPETATRMTQNAQPAMARAGGGA